jgi:hypothetical protein
MANQQAAWKGCVLALMCSAVAALTATAAAAPPSRGGARPTVVIRVEGGFHWLDAGIGAAATLATVLLAYGLALSVRHSNQRR